MLLVGTASALRKLAAKHYPGDRATRTFISFNFGQRQFPRVEPHLDLQYEPIGPLEVVISMYKERTEDVAALIAKLETRRTKDRLSKETNAHEVIKLPNVGREAETYLNHIVNRWDSLAERTVFLQADVHNPREFYPFFERYFRANQTGFLNLGWAGILCNSDDCGDKRELAGRNLAVPEFTIPNRRLPP
ncbi:unnamed protein product [Alternaria alternata]